MADGGPLRIVAQREAAMSAVEVGCEHFLAYLVMFFHLTVPDGVGVRKCGHLVVRIS